MHYFFELTISKLSPGTSAILTHSPLICTGVYDYSTAFNFFTKKLKRIKLIIMMKQNSYLSIIEFFINQNVNQ